MAEYLGALGRLVPLRTSSHLSVAATDRYVSSTTVEGRRRAQVVPASPRTWNVRWNGAREYDLAALSDFVTGAWGAGPWHWVSVAAQSGNLLTPRESMLLDRAGVSAASVQDAGPVRDSDGGWSPRSVRVSIVSGWVALARGVPVHPDKPFTFSCDVQGNLSPGGVSVAFYDAADSYVGGGSAYAPNAGMRRVSLSLAVPAGAVEARVGVREQTVRATRPQVTWTAGPVPFSAGHGCRSAVVDGLSEDLIVANAYGTYSNASFSILEVS